MPPFGARGDRTQVDRFKNLTGTQRIGQSVYDYDGERQLVSLIHRNSSLIQAVGHLYQYNTGGEVSSWSRNGTPTTYSYDASGELLSALPGETFSYDLNGNRTSVTTGTANRALTDGTFDFSYDEEGNLTKKTQLSNGEVTDYVYDHRNRLTSVTRKSSGGTTLSTSSYAYDVKNRRIRKTVNGVTTYSLYNDEDTWADYDSGLNITARYLYGERIDEILARHRPTDGLMCYLPDKLGSIQDISDLSGNPVFTSLYKAFGQITQEIGNLLSGDRFRFTGREYDSETGLYYYRARYYDPILGRFISEDPIRFDAGDLNVYRYVGNATSQKTDPTGNFAILEDSNFIKASVLSAATLLARQTFVVTHESPAVTAFTISQFGGIGGVASALFAQSANVIEAAVSQTEQSARTLGHLTLAYIKSVAKSLSNSKKGRSCTERGGTVVYRVADGKSAMIVGQSWTPENPLDRKGMVRVFDRSGEIVVMSKFRYEAGLFGNECTMLVKGCLLPSTPRIKRDSLENDQYPGSGRLVPEIFVPWPFPFEIEIENVEPINPPL